MNKQNPSVEDVLAHIYGENYDEETSNEEKSQKGVVQNNGRLKELKAIIRKDENFIGR